LNFKIKQKEGKSVESSSRSILLHTRACVRCLCRSFQIPTSVQIVSECPRRASYRVGRQASRVTSAEVQRLLELQQHPKPLKTPLILRLKTPLILRVMDALPLNCMRVVAVADVCRRMQTYANVCSRMLTYAHVFSGRMLT
jgi:hypothetical protein